MVLFRYGMLRTDFLLLRYRPEGYRAPVRHEHSLAVDETLSDEGLNRHRFNRHLRVI